MGYRYDVGQNAEIRNFLMSVTFLAPIIEAPTGMKVDLEKEQK